MMICPHCDEPSVSPWAKYCASVTGPFVCDLCDKPSSVPSFVETDYACQRTLLGVQAAYADARQRAWVVFQACVAFQQERLSLVKFFDSRLERERWLPRLTDQRLAKHAHHVQRVRWDRRH